MRLGGEPATRPSKPVIIGLGLHAARRFLLRTATTAGARVLVRPADGRVDTHCPADTSLGISLGPQPGEDLRPGAVALPTTEPAIQRFPRRVRLGHVPPRRARPDPPPDPVDDD